MGFYASREAIPNTFPNIVGQTPAAAPKPDYPKPFGTRPLYEVLDQTKASPASTREHRVPAFTGPIVLLFLVQALAHIVK